MASGLQKMKLGRKYPQVPPQEMDEIINLFAYVPPSTLLPSSQGLSNLLVAYKRWLRLVGVAVRLTWMRRAVWRRGPSIVAWRRLERGTTTRFVPYPFLLPFSLQSSSDASSVVFVIPSDPRDAQDCQC